MENRRKRLSENYEKRIKEMDEFLQGNKNVLPEYDEDIVRRLISSVKVESGDKLVIQFKTGIVVEERVFL